MKFELCTKEVSWLLGRSEDWLRHGRSTHPQWKTPPHYKAGRRVFYLAHEVVEYARVHGITLPRLHGERGE